MQNRSKFRWLDAQLVIAALAVTGSLVLWNVFAAAARKPVFGPASVRMAERLYKRLGTGVIATQTATALPGATPDMSTPALTGIHLPPIHLLLGGKAPPAQVVVVNSSASVSGGGASNPPPAPPPPVTSTGSSHP